jgi:superfamily I DNA/RNA helicase
MKRKRLKLAQEPAGEELDQFGELEIAEYIVFLQALDTYMRYVEESHDATTEDDVIRKGVMLIRLADRQHAEAIRGFLGQNLPTDVHKRMLTRAFGFLPTPRGLGRRALQIRTLLAKGGTPTMRAVFKSNVALKQARAALAAAIIEDADAALDKFAVIPMRHQRMRDWIDTAAEQAGAGTFQNPIQAANNDAGDAVNELAAEKLRQKAAPMASDEAADADAKQSESLTTVQTTATAAAQRAMKVSGEPDVPPTRSEVIGIATAAAAAAMSDPDHQANVPSALRGPIADDPEQLRAAMTSGRVLVAAGAGSGKTTTLIGRMAYLVQDLKVNPSRIFAVTFNKEAAHGIGEKIAQKVGKEIADQMSIGTMHSIFRGLVMDYGNAEEKAALGKNMIGSRQGVPKEGSTKGRTLTEYLLNTTMSKLWKTCFEEDPPRGPGKAVQSWIMNNVTPEQALEEAADDKERAVATWYAWFQGFKGITKGWKPDCVATNHDADRQWTGFLAEFRSGGKDRLGDFSDMIVMARDLLKRSPEARKKLQGMYDHICVDEAQDLNEVQHEIIRYMSEHVECEDKKRSLWMVGDEIQSINRFAGARPDLFTQFHEDGCFQTRMIGTNYRCLPEIIEAANTLMEHHPRGIPMTTRPHKEKPRGKASILLSAPEDHASGAVAIISEIKQQLAAGAALKEFAVLSRNRIELNDYETACIIEGIPYGRKNGTSFLKSPETTTVMSYMDLVAGADFSKMQRSLVNIIDKPVRLYLPAGKAEQVIQIVINKRAQRLNISSKQVNPIDLFDRQGIADIIREAGTKSWDQDKAMAALEELGDTLQGLRATIQKGTVTDLDSGEPTKFTTKHLIDEILTINGAADKRTGERPKLIDVLMPQNFKSDEPEEDDPDADLNDHKPVGNVAFLYQIAAGTASADTDPSDPLKFKARLDDLEAKAQDLRVNLDAWREEQKALDPDKRKDPPCVVLQTVHSVKGAQWKNTTVIMADGVFPPKPRRGTPAQEAALTDEQLAKRAEKERLDFLTERQLAYVAMTRAAENLTIVSPARNAYGRRAKGAPVFVIEAGLRVGQNVEGKSDPEPIDPVKTASDPESTRSILSYYIDREESFSEADSESGYDWRNQ